VTLNPDASWESMASFPKTRQACEKFLGVASAHQRGELA
jgi:hypothetical protein